MFFPASQGGKELSVQLEDIVRAQPNNAKLKAKLSKKDGSSFILAFKQQVEFDTFKQAYTTLTAQAKKRREADEEFLLDAGGASSGMERLTEAEVKKARELLRTSSSFKSNYDAVVGTGISTEEEFFEVNAERIRALISTDNEQRKVVDGPLVGLFKGHGALGGKKTWNISREDIEQILQVDPIARMAHKDKVPTAMTEEEFWAAYLKDQKYQEEKRISDSQALRKLGEPNFFEEYRERSRYDQMVKGKKNEVRPSVDLLGNEDRLWLQMEVEKTAYDEVQKEIAERNRQVGIGSSLEKEKYEYVWYAKSDHVVSEGVRDLQKISSEQNSKNAQKVMNLNRKETEDTLMKYRKVLGENYELKDLEAPKKVKKLDIKHTTAAGRPTIGKDGGERAGGAETSGAKLFSKEHLEPYSEWKPSAKTSLPSDARAQEYLKQLSAQCAAVKNAEADVALSRDAGQATAVVSQQALNRKLRNSRAKEVMSEAKALNRTVNELLRHLWASLPATSPALAEKAEKVASKLRDIVNNLHDLEVEMKADPAFPPVFAPLIEMAERGIQQQLLSGQ